MSKDIRQRIRSIYVPLQLNPPVAMSKAAVGTTFLVWLFFLATAVAFTVPTNTLAQWSAATRSSTVALRMSDPNPPPFNQAMVDAADPMAESLVDVETMKQLEKQRRAQELREQEVFMKKSTGKHKCSNCDWIYDEQKGDVIMIGGMVQPGTTFEDLPSNWRCPVCRASKDSFADMVIEIPGFAVNQGYGFGTNSWTAGQKNAAIFGGLAAFFVLFLSGYAMS
jgi:rubredoxin